MNSATTPTLEVAYDVAGAGPALVLLHAGVTDRHLWDALIQPLAEHFSVYQPDLRGYGETTVTTRGEWSLHQDVIDFLDALEIEHAHLCGTSIGAMAALNTTLEAPERVDSLILINSALYGFDAWGEASTLADAQIDAATEEGRLEDAAALEVEQWLAGPTRTRADMDDGIADRMTAMVVASYALDKGGEEQAPDPLPIRRLDEVRAPTLVVSGSLDLPEMLTITELLTAGISDSQSVHTATAHLPQFEIPNELAEMMLEFLT